MGKRKDVSLVFMGTPDFAAASLRDLALRFTVPLVVTQPDRPKGRGKKLQPSPVKAMAEELGIPVMTPEVIRSDEDTLAKLMEISPDFIIVVAYGQILSKEILEMPLYGCINLHASLLPAYRGAAPVQEAILKGDEVSGNTTMLMDEGLDTGHILLTNEVKIHETMTAGELFRELQATGPKLLEDTILGLLDGSITPQPQPEEGVSYVSKIKKQDAEIDFTKSTAEILNLIRGMHPVPLAWTRAGDVTVKIHEAKLSAYAGPEETGSILKQDKDGILVRTGDGALSIQVLQLPGKRPMAIKDFLNGNRFDIERFTRSERNV